ncbi:hypothetical protein [Bacillus sp. AK128]
MKGSQLHLRNYVNNHSSLLNKAVFSCSTSLLSFVRGELDIEWKSPLMEEGYKEYQDDFLTLYFNNVNDSSKATKDIREYWPAKGPVWDGVGIVEGHEQTGLVLVEAKAHIGETHSKIKATSDASISKITNTLKITQREFHSNCSIDPWLEEYYQLSNRLAFLHILNDKLKIPTWLVLVNFNEDETYIKTSKEEWLSHYQHVFETLDIKHDSKMLSNVCMVYLPGLS